MRSLYNCNWHTIVYYNENKRLIGKTTYLSTEIECGIKIDLDPAKYTINNAYWEIFRGAPGPLSVEIKSIKGLEAYLNSGKALKQAIMPEYGEQVLLLVLDTVRGFIQSESFLFRERGYQDPDSHIEYWKKVYAGSCRYFSNLDKVDPHNTWINQLSQHNRYDDLYNRFKNVLITGDENTLQANAGLSDSFHEVGLTMSINRKTGEITSYQGNLIRAPYSLCYEADEFTPNLLGKNIETLSKKDTAMALGGQQGCVHIIDLSFDAVKALRTVLGYRL